MIELKFRDKDHLEELIEEYKNLCVQNIIYGINENTVTFTEKDLNEKSNLENKIATLEAENDNLKLEQDKQNKEILIKMSSITKMFEMILGILPMSLTEDINNLIIEAYYILVDRGDKIIEDVPSIVRDQVVEKLNIKLN